MTKSRESVALPFVLLVPAVLVLAFILTLLNNMYNPYTKAVTAAAMAGGPVQTFSIDAYEDGSGVLYKGEQEIATFDSDFFLWDCTENGNGICGPGAFEYANVVSEPACQTFVIGNNPARALDTDYTFVYCTNGDLTWHPATDVEVEGEVL